MTQPTQAQIEAAAKAICDHRHYPDTEAWLNLGELQGDYLTMAKAALIAAAQVGMSDEDRRQVEKQIIFEQRGHTIERCAQVAERFDSDEAICDAIADEIRKLKDAP